ncbi:hypothetical protein B9Z55_021446 [Caenorhabditis nigoni]|uniref:Uncharacterized protein n=1 Tax=Caenorhabditis nigoni TaxID=1611254 RepID=A0A2G5TRZ7_9PELO|nr:hypothetical protein B9Z55_021446 [Caenorhabditis nigoni]
MFVDIRTHRHTEKSIISDPKYREELRNLDNMKRQRYFQNIFIEKLHKLFQGWQIMSFMVEIQLMIRLSSAWSLREDMHRFNVFYALRKLFYFVISNPKLPEFTPHFWPVCFQLIHIYGYLLLQGSQINFYRQMMILQIIYIVAKYTVDDARSVIWPFILVNEIWDVLTVFKYRTTEYLSFQLLLWKILTTFEHFVLLNQYQDFCILIWLLVIVSLQIFSFSLYCLYPPLTWTVPILDIAPTQAPKKRFSIYTRHVAIVIVLIIFAGLWAL